MEKVKYSIKKTQNGLEQSNNKKLSSSFHST